MRGRPATAAASRASISGVSGLAAQSTSSTSGGKRAAASSSGKIPFCSLMRPTKSTYGGADPVAIEGIAALGAAEGGGVDAIVQHDHARGIDAEMREDVLAHLRGDRDDAARLLDGGRLGPGRHHVAAPELVLLPRAQRLHAVQRHHQRDIEELLHEEAAERRVPGMGVHDVGVDGIGRHREPDRQRLERRRIASGPAAGQALPRRIAAHAQAGLGALGVARAEAAHLDRRPPGERPAQVIDDDARAPVDVGRVLATQEQDVHGGTSTGRAYPTAPGAPHERRRSLRLPRLPRAARAPRLRGARRARAGRAARARARGERLLPHGRRPHAPLGADGDVSERFRPVGRQRGARRATGRAAVGRRSLPVRLDGARARGAGLDHRRSPAAPLRRSPAEPGPAVPVLPDASRGRPDRAPGADAPRVSRRPRRGGRERALLPHHRRALSPGAWAERFRRVDRPHARPPASWRSASRTSIPASGASSASATATSAC